ncbi:ATP-dependent helicase dcl2 [Penicillium samsonianum]|uniref:ATP-dependent helicase dcl2 n=1 Tax=Penicillium samsonianum TaxID=1882272 RepID=UPI002546BE24|nr:ATP-dependent helicase dcl2 [Penicillium samsonianum]KAJ6126048.1 ATP-dependent helicase dcl2 [Penicillium samsonianum]
MLRASMRIMAELERCQDNQMVWFLVPTKVLCIQQLTYISRHIPAVSMRMLTGDDGVECWSNQEIWDAALRGLKVVFATHAVLADALTHGFVKLQDLALLVFDEAHHCVKSHPGNRIMRDFYHRVKAENSSAAVPSILGLTASVDPKKVRELEKNLDATCRAPLVQRQELAEHVSDQNLTRIVYSRDRNDAADLPFHLQRLEKIVMELREDSKTMGHPSRTSISDGTGGNMQAPGNMSNKVERLLLFLKAKACANLSGIIFVRERATAYVLSALLNEHPLTHGLFRCAPCVSSSTHSEHWAIDNSLILKKSEEVVTDFRCGTKNLIVATNVLEEGIDIPACHLVISFELPDNMTSYIQRRGRARQSISEFVIMEEDNCESLASRQWNVLEKKMQELCLDHHRRHQIVKIDDGESENIVLRLSLDTGALLTAENAISHLYHFCTTLQSETPGRTSPSFSCESNEKNHFRSTVYLPSGVDSSLRVAKGRHWWATKQSARQDAAFQAVHALHRQSLINDHFLPLFQDNSWAEMSQQKAVAAELPLVENFISFWKDVPGHWTERTIYRCRIEVSKNGEVQSDLAMALFTPVKLPIDANVDLYWDNQTTFRVTLQPFNLETALSPFLRSIIREITTLLFHSTRGKSPQEDYSEFLPFFTPDLPLEELEDWLDINRGSLAIWSEQTRVPLLSPGGFIRSPKLHFTPHIFVRWIRNPDASGFTIECRPFEKRRNLIQQATLADQISTQTFTKTACIAATECTIDFLPWELGRTSLLIPPIIQLLHQHLMAQSMRVEIFGDVPEIGLSSLAEAITSPSSQWPVNYQRLEFLGDSLIKFLVSTHVFYTYPRWHEGYLSKMKDLLVSNERLTQAAVSAHLEQFICADFITRKHPIFWQNKGDAADKGIPRKVYADVVEALVAAAYEHGGNSLSRKLVGIFLPEISDFTPIPQEQPKKNCQFPVHLEIKLDKLLGFKFKNRALIWEALTHPSWQRDQTTGSYQRLEFLGDAVLDFLVARRLHAQVPKLAEGRMTEIRAALVNADFLAFLCMDFAPTETCYYGQEITASNFGATVQPRNTALWMFMRHDASDVVKMQTSCSNIYRMLGDAVKKPLKSGRSYPWATLAQLRASKFYSDLIESTIGAIFVESGGDLDACERFLERIELMAYLERFAAHDVELEHPKSAMDRIMGTRKADFRVKETENSLHDISVWMEGEEVASINHCSSRAEAFVRAAEATLSFLSRTSN